MTFRVPNESDTASTVSLRIQIPEEAAMASCASSPCPAGPPRPTTADDRGAAPRRTAGDHQLRLGGRVPGRRRRRHRAGEFQEFSLSGGPFPEAESLAFPAVQGYSDGSETAWIEPTVEGQASPSTRPRR